MRDPYRVGSDSGHAATVTIQVAADTLGVSPNRVYQLLRDGRLEGPAVPTGRLRAAPRTRRVSWRSLEAELARRAERGAPTNAGGRARREAFSSLGMSPHAAAVLEMKARLDAARDALRSERLRSAKLAKTLEEVTLMLAESIGRENVADDLAEGYSAAIRQLLGPHDTSGVTGGEPGSHPLDR